MKKEYIKPECYVIEVELESVLAMSEGSIEGEAPGDGEENPFGSREDYRPNRPGSTNIWDQGW